MRKRLMRNTYSYWILLLISLVLSETGQSAPTTLDSLPRDVIYNVQEYLDLDDYKAMRSVSRSLCERLGFFEGIKKPPLTLNLNNYLISDKYMEKLFKEKIKKTTIKGNIQDLHIFFSKISTILNKCEKPIITTAFFISQNDTDLAKKISDSSYMKLMNNIEWIDGRETVSPITFLSDPKKIIISVNQYYPDNLGILLKKTHINNIEHFEYKQSFFPARIKEKILPFLGGANFTKIKTLILRGSMIGDQVCDLLANNTTFITLAELDLSGNYIQDLGLKKILQSKVLTTLAKLYLSQNDISLETEEKIESILDDLNILDLSNNKIGISGVFSILESDGFHSLGELYLQNNKICGEYEHIIETTSNKNMFIRTLDMSGNKISDELLNNILSHTSLSILKTLKIKNSYFSIQAKDIKYPSSIKCLMIENNHNIWNGTTNISNSFFERLQELYLSDNDMSLGSIQTLLKTKNINRLKTLFLENTNITDEDIFYLSKSKNVSFLQNLNVSNNYLTKKSLQLIEQSFFFEALTSIHLNNIALKIDCLSSFAKNRNIKNIFLSDKMLQKGPSTSVKNQKDYLLQLNTYKTKKNQSDCVLY